MKETKIQRNLKLETLPSYFEQVLNESSIAEYQPREAIVVSGSLPNKLLFVLSGKAKISMIHENGRRTLLQFTKEGDFIGELSLLSLESYTKDVTAVSQVTCLAVPMGVAKEKLLQDLAFMQALGTYLGKKVLYRVDQFSNNQNFELKYRLATYMLEAAVDGVYNEKHTETADFLGVSYRHLLYTLKQFQDEGLIKKQGNSLILNRIAMEPLKIN